MAGGHGGARPGSGRKPGSRDGASVIRTLRGEAREMLAEIVGTERDPLLVAINIAADPSVPLLIRLEAALGTAKYLHPTLSAAQVQHISAPAAADAARTRLQAQIDRLAGDVPLLEGEADPEPEPAEGRAADLTLADLDLEPAEAEAA